MDEKDIKSGLEDLTKQEIVDTFQSLEIKLSDGNKAFLVEAVLAGEPTGEEIEAFKKLVSENSVDEKKPDPPKKKGPPEKLKRDYSERSDAPEKAGKYIVVHTIKEDGKTSYNGDDYIGRWAKRYLKNGQIRKRD